MGPSVKWGAGLQVLQRARYQSRILEMILVAGVGGVKEGELAHGIMESSEFSDTDYRY